MEKVSYRPKGPADHSLCFYAFMPRRVLHLLRHMHSEAGDVRPFLRERFGVREKLLERVGAMRNSNLR